MVAEDRLSNLITKLQAAIEAAKKVFNIAPDIIPSSLEMFVFLATDQVKDTLTSIFNSAPDNKHSEMCNTLERAITDFVAIVDEMETKIKIRQQPKDLPRRDGPRTFKQFRPRKGDWS
jgi:hypothetical protein